MGEMLIWETWLAICGVTRTAGAAVQFFLADGNIGNYKWGNWPQLWLLLPTKMLFTSTLSCTTPAPGLNTLIYPPKFMVQGFLYSLCSKLHSKYLSDCPVDHNQKQVQLFLSSLKYTLSKSYSTSPIILDQYLNMLVCLFIKINFSEYLSLFGLL